MTENEVTVMMAEAIDKDRQYAPLTCSTKHLMIFAEMVAEKEREACAKICEKHGNDYYCEHITDKLSKAIREMGQPKPNISITMRNTKNIVHTGIEKLGLTIYTEHHLKRDDIISIEQLECCTEDRLRKTPNIGSKSIKEIKEQMAKFGYKLRDKNE